MKFYFLKISFFLFFFLVFFLNVEAKVAGGHPLAVDSPTPNSAVLLSPTCGPMSCWTTCGNSCLYAECIHNTPNSANNYSVLNNLFNHLPLDISISEQPDCNLGFPTKINTLPAPNFPINTYGGTIGAPGIHTIPMTSNTYRYNYCVQSTETWNAILWPSHDSGSCDSSNCHCRGNLGSAMRVYDACPSTNSDHSWSVPVSTCCTNPYSITRGGGSAAIPAYGTYCAQTFYDASMCYDDPGCTCSGVTPTIVCQWDGSTGVYTRSCTGPGGPAYLGTSGTSGSGMIQPTSKPADFGLCNSTSRPDGVNTQCVDYGSWSSNYGGGCYACVCGGTAGSDAHWNTCNGECCDPATAPATNGSSCGGCQGYSGCDQYHCWC